MRRAAAAAATVPAAAAAALAANLSHSTSYDSLVARTNARLPVAAPPADRDAELLSARLASPGVAIVRGVSAAETARDAIAALDPEGPLRLYLQRDEPLDAAWAQVQAPGRLAAEFARRFQTPTPQVCLSGPRRLVLCLFQPHLEEEATRRWVCEEALPLGATVCVVADGTLFAAEFCEELLRSGGEDPGRVTHHSVSLPASDAAAAALLARCGAPEWLASLAAWVRRHTGCHPADLASLFAALDEAGGGGGDDWRGGEEAAGDGDCGGDREEEGEAAASGAEPGSLGAAQEERAAAIAQEERAAAIEVLDAARQGLVATRLERLKEVLAMAEDGEGGDGGEGGEGGEGGGGGGEADWLWMLLGEMSGVPVAARRAPLGDLLQQLSEEEVGQLDGALKKRVLHLDFVRSAAADAADADPADADGGVQSDVVASPLTVAAFDALRADPSLASAVERRRARRERAEDLRFYAADAAELDAAVADYALWEQRWAVAVLRASEPATEGDSAAPEPLPPRRYFGLFGPRKPWRSRGAPKAEGGERDDRGDRTGGDERGEEGGAGRAQLVAAEHEASSAAGRVAVLALERTKRRRTLSMHCSALLRRAAALGVSPGLPEGHLCFELSEAY